METKIVEYNELIAVRVPPSDRWELVEDKTNKSTLPLLML